jgi:hypothetical protein
MDGAFEGSRGDDPVGELMNIELCQQPRCQEL